MVAGNGIKLGLLKLDEAGGLARSRSPCELTTLLHQREDEDSTGGRSFSPACQRPQLFLKLGLALLATAAIWAMLTVARPLAPSPHNLMHSLGGYQAKNAEGQMPDYQCLDSYALSDFSSKGNMELAGWAFNWDDEFTFKPPIYQMYAPSTAYWGCSKHGGGTISLTLQGQGLLTLDFGNSWGNSTSSVTAFLNGAEEDVAGPYTFSKTVQIHFKDGDTLDIVEGTSGVIVINSITFRCERTTTTTSEPPPTSTRTVTTTTVTVTTTTITKTITHFLMQDDLDDTMGESAPTPAPTSTTTVPTTTTTTTTAVSTTTSAWKDIENAKHKWLREYDELQRKRFEEEKKREQLEHQLELEQAVLKRIKKERKEIRKATEAEKEALLKAKAEREDAQHQREKLLRDQESKSSSKSKEEGKQTEVRSKQLAKVEKEGNQTVARSTRLARAVEEQKQHTQEELQRLKTARVKEQEEEEQMAENMEDELAKVKGGPKGQKRHGAQGAADFEAPSLYCYSLMLPFGYEPELLKAQKDRQVGIFACNEYAVFSNSSVMLDTGEPLPLDDVILLKFSLAVPYGGKWHTALNTGVFNGVWTEIVGLGNYRMHDWVVKADPDTVLFPSRLVQLLQLWKPMNEITNRVSRRRLHVESETGRRLQWNVGSNASCGTCQMPGFQGQTCTSHVQYIQKEGHSCSEALRRVARAPPTDCGCDCNRVEACDFQMDPKMYKNYKVIEGKAYPGAMYINNCKFGLHGPIEVLSQRAVTAYVEGLPRCNNLLVHPWGEDKFMDRCMLELGITRVNQFGLLSEIACGEKPAPCGDSNVAFHPFKSIHSYFACWEYAQDYGHGPADPKFAKFPISV